MIKAVLRAAINGGASLLPLRRRVLLESSPDLSCNVFPVFQELLRRPALQGVSLTWLVREPALWRAAYPQTQVSFVEYRPEIPWQRARAIRLALSSKCVLFCNKTLWPPRRGQLSLFLGHGTPIKCCRGFYTPGPFCNRWSYPSEQVKAVMERELGLAPEQGRLLGYPRCDALTRPQGLLDRVVPREGKKVIFWLPTFRQHTKSYDNNYALSGCGLPLLEEAGALETLNEALERAGLLLILKPHPMQDLSVIRAGSLSAFRLIGDEDLRQAGVQLYEALADADALLTDYSSVYCDFLLTGKPIGLTLDDLAAYQEKRGLVMEDITQVLKGRYLYTLSDLVDFAGDIAAGRDPERAARQQACDYYNHWQDGGSAGRVADLIQSYFEKGEM